MYPNTLTKDLPPKNLCNKNNCSFYLLFISLTFVWKEVFWRNKVYITNVLCLQCIVYIVFKYTMDLAKCSGWPGGVQMDFDKQSVHFFLCHFYF